MPARSACPDVHFKVFKLLNMLFMRVLWRCALGYWPCAARRPDLTMAGHLVQCIKEALGVPRARDRQVTHV